MIICSVYLWHGIYGLMMTSFFQLFRHRRDACEEMDSAAGKSLFPTHPRSCAHHECDSTVTQQTDEQCKKMSQLHGWKGEFRCPCQQYRKSVAGQSPVVKRDNDALPTILVLGLQLLSFKRIIWDWTHKARLRRMRPSDFFPLAIARFYNVSQSFCWPTLGSQSMISAGLPFRQSAVVLQRFWDPVFDKLFAPQWAPGWLVHEWELHGEGTRVHFVWRGSSLGLVQHTDRNDTEYKTLTQLNDRRQVDEHLGVRFVRARSVHERHSTDDAHADKRRTAQPPAWTSYASASEPPIQRVHLKITRTKCQLITLQYFCCFPGRQQMLNHCWQNLQSLLFACCFVLWVRFPQTGSASYDPTRVTPLTVNLLKTVVSQRFRESDQRCFGSFHVQFDLVRWDGRERQTEREKETQSSYSLRCA